MTTNDATELPVLTALLAYGHTHDDVARVARGMPECRRLIEEILSLDHVRSETTLSVGDVEFHQNKNGPFPNHQFRVSVRPQAGCAALNYMDNDDAEMPVANSYNPRKSVPDVILIFNGSTGLTFPRSAIISITDARRALLEWLQTRKRPTCIEWRPYDFVLRPDGP
ncbi:Imm1 family immunity protein [Actinokineospora sp. NBRC 105648]|uniref:Imm1 family immunity protein n=1 Tax=Actinokineospora sp. NBRC 105648 TaxID=3032206 RepID=UPI003331248C